MLLTFFRGACLSVLLAAPALAAQPPALDQHDIQIHSHRVNLAGTVYLPHDRPITAGIVIVHGSGREVRMTGLARFFAARGIAALTYDKRGVDQSGGIYAGPEVGTNNVSPDNLNLLADDAANAMQALSSERALRKVPVGFLGVSQAGWIIPLAALQSPEARFMLLFSGPTTSTRQQLRFQFLTNGDQDFWLTHSESDVDALLAAADPLSEFPDFDPHDTLMQLKIPGLWIFGGQDIQIRTSESITALETLRASGHPKFYYRIFPDVGHNTAGDDEHLLEAVHWIEAIASSPLSSAP